MYLCASDMIKMTTFIKRLAVLFFAAAVLTSCTKASMNNLIIKNYSVSELHGVSFDQGAVGSSATLQLEIENPTSTPFSLESFKGEIYLASGSRFATIATLDGEICTVEPGFDGTVTIPFSISLANPLALLSGSLLNLKDAGSIEEKFKNCTVDVDAVVRAGAFRKNFKKNGIPIDTVIEKVKSSKKR